MSELLLEPEFTPVLALAEQLKAHSYAVVSPNDLLQLIDLPIASLEKWVPSWNDLPADHYLKDGGKYRRRRHSSFVVQGQHCEQVAHRAHWQPVSYNALHGGMVRWFEPMQEAISQDPDWGQFLCQLGELFSQLKGVTTWYVESHQFRIDTAGGIGRPTPEGAHRDGVDFVVVMLIDRRRILGGESRIFAAQGRHGERFTLQKPFTTVILDDEKVIHETTPIRPTEQAGHRDTLVLTFRKSGFQEE